MGEAKFKQEFECSFTGNQPGSIYGDIISDLEDQKITKYLTIQAI